MPLVTTKEMFKSAQENGYAIPAFNIENMETAQAVIAAAEELRSPVIIQTTPSTVKYGSTDLFFGIINVLAKNSTAEIALHLDHGNSFELAVKAVESGYTSIMIDGSQLKFDDNAALTKKTADFCAAHKIPLEAELGKVGGKEDDTESAEVGYTDPDEAAEFVKITGVNSLAVGIGTSHGIYKGTPKLDIGRVKKIAERIDIPLVLHGTSGVPHDDVKKCIANGIRKVNYATELRISFTDGVKTAITSDSNAFDPKFYLGNGKKSVYEAVKKLIAVCGSHSI